jgi:hypothetical protein
MGVEDDRRWDALYRGESPLAWILVNDRVAGWRVRARFRVKTCRFWGGATHGALQVDAARQLPRCYRLHLATPTISGLQLGRNDDNGDKDAQCTDGLLWVNVSSPGVYLS